MLIVFGSVNADLVFMLPALPRPGETVLCPGFAMSPGGKGANQAVAAARGGADTRFFGRVGRDDHGAAMRAVLTGAGIDCSGLLASDRPTGVAVIGVDPAGENAIIVGSGANLDVSAADVPDVLLGPGATVLAQNEVPPSQTLALMRRASARGARTILNLAPTGGVAPGELGGLDILIVNEHEAAALAGRADPEEAAGALAGAAAAAVIVTLGAAGVLAATPGRRWRVPALPVAVVDTTGAGDAFVGMLAACIDEGLGLEAALPRAAIAGALACERLGAQEAMPGRARVEERLRAWR